MTKEAAADFLGVSRKTLHTKLSEQPELQTAWGTWSRTMLQANTMDWLITSAQKGDVKAQMFLAERVCGLSPKAFEQDAASAAEDNAQHIRAALKRMIVIENGVWINQEQADDHVGDESVEIDQ